jgi:competence protein ComEA
MTAHVIHLALRRLVRVGLPALALAATLGGEILPDAPGKAETEKLCTQCHDLAKSVSLRQDRNGWGDTLTKMIGLGMKGTDQEMRTVLEYLEAHFAPEALPPINLNNARAIELESRLSLKRSEASAILKYRQEHGDFKSIEDLKSVPGIDFAKIESKKDQLVFE